MYNKSFIYEYWSRSEIGQEMIKSEFVSDTDLLFLMPNNVKKMHGLPMTRISGKGRKSVIKKRKKKFIRSYKFFELVEEIVEKTIVRNCAESKFFWNFVDIKEICLGDKNKK